MLVQQLLTDEYELYDTENDAFERTNLAFNPEEKGALERLKVLLELNARGNFVDQRIGR